MRPPWRAAALLLALEAAAFGVCARTIGFYHDDWGLLESVARGGGYWGGVREMLKTPLAVRTLGVLWLSLPGLLGTSPFVYQLLLMAQDAACAFLFYLLLMRLLGRPRLALTAAALALVHPSHPATHHWFSDGPQSMALALTLGAMILAFDARERGDRRREALAAALYFASLLFYEAAALLPLTLGAALFLERRGSGAKAALKSAARALAPFGGALAAGGAWQLLLPRLLLASAHPKAKAAGLGHAAHALRSAVECLTIDTFDIARRTAAAGHEIFGAAGLAAWTATALAAAAVLATTAEPKKTPPLSRALWLAAVVFAAAYAPYALSNYDPQVLGVMSRINGTGALAAALLLAAAVEALRARTSAAPAAALAAALVASFVWTDWYVARMWAEAWTVENRILALVGAKKDLLPQGATVLLRGAPEDFNGAPLFSASWDFDAALRVSTGRADLRGDVVKTGMNSEAEGVVYRKGGAVVRVFPYDRLFTYDYSEQRLYRLAGP